MENQTIYISPEASCVVNHTPVKIKDIATIHCSGINLKNKVEQMKLPISLSNKNDQVVITVLKIIQVIENDISNVSIVPVGPTETVVYFKDNNSKKTLSAKLLPILLMILAFFGTGYSIMSYNGDVGTLDLLKKLCTLFTGEKNPSDTTLSFGIVAYSAGLCIGMITFFNHGFNKNSAKDPTPLQVQMRLYEQEVNTCITIDSSRKKDTIDVN